MSKKNFFQFMTCIIITCLSLCVVSCGSDDDEGGDYNGSELVDKLQGVWQFSNGTETVMGMTITIDKSTLSQMKKSLEQSIGSKVEFWDETLSFSGTKVNGVNYSLRGTELILDGMDDMDGMTISIKSVTNSTLILHEVISMEGIDLIADMEYSK